MNLLLMRHGSATFDAPTDDLRELSDYGREQVQQQMVKSLQSAVPWDSVNQILTSPYARAKQTVDVIMSADLPINADTLVLDNSVQLIPDSSCASVQELLVEQTQNILLVSHQPLISRLVGYFCDADEHASHPMMPASLAWLTGDVFAKGCMQLNAMLHVI